MNTGANLENELVNGLQELTNAEQDELKVVSALYINEYENLKADKVNSLKNSLNEQIKFYGRKPVAYSSQINEFVTKYEGMIDDVIKEYNTRYIAVNNELQDTQSNQKIAIVNIKYGINFKDNTKMLASENKRDNYEIVMNECIKQLGNCQGEMSSKINQIFYNKDKQLSNGRTNIFERIINIFTGKSKVDNFVINSVYMELNQLQNTVNAELPNIKEETIKNIAVIKDARIQTQKIFNRMLEGQM